MFESIVLPRVSLTPRCSVELAWFHSEEPIDADS